MTRSAVKQKFCEAKPTWTVVFQNLSWMMKSALGKSGGDAVSAGSDFA
jgi:hypothetical protein